jgi:hypothetical protein
MRPVAILSLLAVLGSAAAQTRTAMVPVTVVLDFEQSQHVVSLNDVQAELQKLLAGSKLSVNLRLRKELPANPQLGDLVVFKMRGHCTAAPLPVGALSDERGALAMTYTNDGEILPFGEVECDQVRQSLERILGRADDDRHRAAFGLAVARVIAHEIYHMLGNSKAHTKTGITEESLSAVQLSQPHMGIPEEAQAKLQTSDASRSQ